MKKKLVFPNLFWWGAASSGPQTEGQYGKVHENVFASFLELCYTTIRIL
ncbi:glycosyl hydrolase family protein [Streptococcus pneumoniae]|nr:glycosyl hydrolase family protein [Streptococcus pneumoniae]